jgi:hypothetical protein
VGELERVLNGTGESRRAPAADETGWVRATSGVAERPVGRSAEYNRAR